MIKKHFFSVVPIGFVYIDRDRESTIFEGNNHNKENPFFRVALESESPTSVSVWSRLQNTAMH